MLYFAPWKIVVILLVTLAGILFSTPNFLGRSTAEQMLPSWLAPVNLGLDLQGGSHLLLSVDVDAVVRERMESVVDAARVELRRADIGYSDLGVVGTSAVFTVRDEAQRDAAAALAGGLDDETAVSVVGNRIEISLTDAARAERQRSAVEQSVEIVRRRIDETGTREPSIQRQGEDRILVQLPGIDDPERIKALIGTTAAMNFHILDDEMSPQEAQRTGRVPAGSMLLPGEGEGDGPYLVRRRVMVSGDTLVDAQPTFQDGQPVVSFRFDTLGARRFAETTEQNVGRFLAIVLDNRVISAPVVREPIRGGSGIISGSFTVQQAQDLALLLRAGALPAPLTVLEERTVGPGLGADSIAAGEIASVIGLVLILVFMVVCYGLFGLLANVALLVNLVLVLGALSALQATLTLPGIAGIVLTIGMAVDANVLIFERMREEIRNGRTPIAAADAGFQRAVTTIVDANLTTLIATALLFHFGTGPIRGFAVTLSIGIIASMFTAIMVTRFMVVLWLRRHRREALPI